MKPLRAVGLVMIATSLAVFSTGSEGNKAPVAAGARLERIATDLGFAEGPTCTRDGTLYFTDQPNNRILRWTVTGGLAVWLEGAERSNGLCVDAAGRVVAAAERLNQLIAYSPEGERQVLARGFNHRPFNGPNDLWIAPDGGAYITDPYYQRSWFPHSAAPQDTAAVYHFDPKTNILRRVANGFVRPNGITGTADGRYLYVSDIGAKKTYRFRRQPDGSLTDQVLFCAIGSDGMTIDADGHLYLSSDRVVIVDEAGQPFGEIIVPERPSNLCFGGHDRRTLFITARTSVYALAMAVAGANPAK